MAPGFICFDAYLEKTRGLTDEGLGRLFRALMRYHMTGEISDLSGAESIAFDFIRTDLDAGDEKYRARCETNRRNRLSAGSREASAQEAAETDAPVGITRSTIVNDRTQKKIKRKNQSKNQKKNKKTSSVLLSEDPSDLISSGFPNTGEDETDPSAAALTDVPCLSSPSIQPALPTASPSRRKADSPDMAPEEDPDPLSGMSFSEAVAYLREKVNYEALKCNYDLPWLENVIDLMAEMLITPAEYLNISGSKRPAEYVRKQILAYNHTLMEYLLNSMNECSSSIRNVNKYMMACILNAPNSIHYDMNTQARHVMYGMQ